MRALREGEGSPGGFPQVGLHGSKEVSPVRHRAQSSVSPTTQRADVPAIPRSLAGCLGRSPKAMPAIGSTTVQSELRERSLIL